jgi:phosphoribosylglycinamide formyltransferase 1
MSRKTIVFFASGSGSNVENIVQYFRKKEADHRFVVFCNNPNAGVFERCARLGITVTLFDKKQFRETGEVLLWLEELKPDLVVLAGFLWLMPEVITQRFPQKMLNIHPALLPKYGGKGMYGMHVHQAVVENKDTETGITIHYVNELYDKGQIILQATCPLTASDSPQDVAQKVHELEYKHFPSVVEKLLG